MVSPIIQFYGMHQTLDADSVVDVDYAANSEKAFKVYRGSTLLTLSEGVEILLFR